MATTVESFFDPETFTYSYVVVDAATAAAVIIDPVLDFDHASGRVSTASADAISAYVEREALDIVWILDTHVHADHLSAMAILKDRHGGKTGVGERVTEVQSIFAETFNAREMARDGSQFDRRLRDGDELVFGDSVVRVMETPGHTPACVTYVIDDAAFVGDTLFMPDYGTARTDFPGGDAGQLYASIQRILDLPGETTLYLCHDYGSATRSTYHNVTSVHDERANNVHIGGGVELDAFVRERRCRDAGLAAPKLLLPSIQFNIRAGHFPPAEDNGTRYLKIPVRVA